MISGRRSATRALLRNVTGLAGAILLGLHPPARADDALASAIMAKLAALPDRQADFTDERHVASLAAPVRSSGRLVFRHPAHLEKITTAPRPERLVIDRGVLDITTPEAAHEVQLDAHPALQALANTIAETLAGDLPGLQRLYQVQASGALAAWQMTLTPRDPGLARFITRIRLGGAGADLRSLTIQQSNGGTETMAVRPAG